MGAVSGPCCTVCPVSRPKETTVLRGCGEGSGVAGSLTARAAPHSCAGCPPSLQEVGFQRQPDFCPLSLSCSASGSGHPCSWGLRAPRPHQVPGQRHELSLDCKLMGQEPSPRCRAAAWSPFPGVPQLPPSWGRGWAGTAASVFWNSPVSCFLASKHSFLGVCGRVGLPHGALIFVGGCGAEALCAHGGEL